MANYEPEEEETVSAASIKKVLKELIDDLKQSKGDSAARERQSYQQEYNVITDIENRIKLLKNTLKEQQIQLELKLRLKRVGDEEFKAETIELLEQVQNQLMGLNASKKEEKAKINALNKDKKALEIKLSYPEGLLTEVGGQLRDEEAKKLILKKLYDWVSEQLTRYLNGEKRGLVAKVENLWDKYAVSSQEMESQREQTLGQLNEFLVKLGYRD